MKLKFNSDLQFQLDAINSITGLFKGQQNCSSTHSISNDNNGMLITEDSVGNRLCISKEQVLDNLQNIQIKNLLPISDIAKLNNGLDFTVEMETGTGKTYVYLRTIFELNKIYGFTKFIIVVPSIPIKEGVLKSISIMQEHFKALYENVSFEHFVYDSKKPTQVRSFASSNNLQIMIMNIASFNKSFNDSKKDNIIHRNNDKMQGKKPIEFIQSTRPILILDEPQSIDNTDIGKKAIKTLNPLFNIRYSATHKDTHNQVYKLDSIDAYEQKLVKQIEVAGIEIFDGFNTPYIKLLSINPKNLSASIEIDKFKTDGVSVERKKITVDTKSKKDIYKLSNNRSLYDDLFVTEIDTAMGGSICFSNGEALSLGETIGDVNKAHLQRLQIRKTIEEHLKREITLIPKGIKVLSLFFIDKVANYRSYDADKNPIKGKFAEIFEEEYTSLSKEPRFAKLYNAKDLASDAHDGYFSIDTKKTDARGNAELKETRSEDESAYNLIMKDKEKLLSLDCKLRFIFSHSALKEGWDNPNVFQICTLNETKSQDKKRQEIGRGLRICVNQQGERVFSESINILTVMANESYKDFASTLQKEIEAEEGIKFGSLKELSFVTVYKILENGDLRPLTQSESKSIYDSFESNEYINNKGKIQDSLKKDLTNNEVKIPEAFEAQREQIVAVIKKSAGRLNINNHKERRTATLRKEVFLQDDFKSLWDKIKHKTVYRVDFNSDELIAKCIEQIKSIEIKETNFEYTKAKLNINESGVAGEVVLTSGLSTLDNAVYQVPDIVGFLQDKTDLTRKAIVEILYKSKCLDKFKKNPQKFIELAQSCITKTMQSFLVDGIKYEKLNDYYAQELFESEELTSYLDKMQESKRGLYDYVVYDSSIESKFAKDMDLCDEVKLYVKLPSWFKINTPLGSYNPDWAVLIEAPDNNKKLYFVVETKSTLNEDQLRINEYRKIQCATKMYSQTLSDENMKYKHATNLKDLI